MSEWDDLQKGIRKLELHENYIRVIGERLDAGRITAEQAARETEGAKAMFRLNEAERKAVELWSRKQARA